MIASLRVSNEQIAAYGRAADECGMSRHAWMITAIANAAGVGDGEYCHINGLRPLNLDMLPARKTRLAIRLPDEVNSAATIAARLALRTLGDWFVLVLDCAAGISALVENLHNVGGTTA